MYSLLPHAMLFSLTLTMSTLAVLSSSTFLIMWSALELNLMSLIPLMLLSNNKLESEAAVKYFLAQALGSSLFLISYLSLSHNLVLIMSQTTQAALMSIALLIKLGAAPSHFWFPSVMSSTSWPICIILATWQKIAPLMMLSSMFTPSINILFLSAALSGLVGGIMGLNQTQLTALLAYSSIGHLGWILSMIHSSSYMAALYFLTYSATTSALMMIFHKTNFYSVKQTSSSLSILPSSFFIPTTLLLSLGGLPPLLGFMPKLMALNILSSQTHLLLASILIISSALTLSYYLTLMFNLYITSTNPLLPTPASRTSLLLPSIIITFPLVIFPLVT